MKFCCPKLSLADQIYEKIGYLFSVWPFTILTVTLIISIVLTWNGISINGIPEFSDPYLGFETRFTPIANSLVTLENFRRATNRLELLENYPGEKISDRQLRRRRTKRGIFPDPNGLCNNFPLDDYGRVALSLEAGSKSIFSQQQISLICYFQDLIQYTSNYAATCESNGDESCCPMWSLPNYIALYSNKSDCSMVDELDIAKFEKDSEFCRGFYLNRTMNELCLLRTDECAKKCQKGSILHTAIFYTIDKSYLISNSTKYTMIILPVANSGSNPLLEDLQESIMNIIMPKHSTIALVGINFGEKYNLFKSYLIRDLQYVIVASVIIFAIVCIYTKSIFLTVIVFLSLTLSLGVTYFLYMNIFRISYFPFMNMLVTIIVLGIGTDSTLIFSVVWQRNIAPLTEVDKQIRTKIMIETLRETTLPLIITTLTTAGAFFASLTSSITTIRCFSIFAGTAIILSFVLLYICVPTSCVLSGHILSYFYSLLKSPNVNEKGKFFTKLEQFYEKIENNSRLILQNLTFRRSCNKSSSKRTYIRIFWIISFLVFFSLFIWSTIVVSNFELPNSEEFQLLSSTHPVEKYDLVKKAFYPNEEDEFLDERELNRITLYFIWGLQSIDTGNGLDPTDDGKLVLDPTFSLSSKENQIWMKDFCAKVKVEKFYDQIGNSLVGHHYDSCFIDTFKGWMQRDCEHHFRKNESYRPCCKDSQFPYEPSVFSKCISLAARDLYRTPALYFTPDIAGAKFYILEHSNKDTNNSGSLATFTIRVKTNVTQSLSYEKMNTFYKDIQEFFNNNIMKDAPNGLKNGFFVSADLDFYDLQNSLLNDTWGSFLLSVGLCFFFIWISSKKIFIALGAVFTIFVTVTVTSSLLIQLFNWKLGVFESIAVTVSVGLSDFTAHHSIEFSKRKSVFAMTSPTFFSAITTITMGLSMLIFSNVLVYQKIGSFFFVLVLTSWIYSVYFLSPVLFFFDKVLQLIKSVCKRRKEEKFDTIIENEYINHNEEEEDFDNELDEASNEIKQSLMVEKYKMFKKISQETSI